VSIENRADYLALMRLKNNPDFQVLQGRWVYKLSQIQTARDNAAARGQEGAWRYYAGQEKGAQIILLSLDMAIKELESDNEEVEASGKYKEIVDELLGEKNK